MKNTTWMPDSVFLLLYSTLCSGKTDPTCHCSKDPLFVNFPLPITISIVNPVENWSCDYGSVSICRTLLRKIKNLSTLLSWPSLKYNPDRHQNSKQWQSTKLFRNLKNIFLKSFRCKINYNLATASQWSLSTVSLVSLSVSSSRLIIAFSLSAETY